MKYMLLIYGDEQALSTAEATACYEESSRLAHRLHAAGQFLSTAPLHPTATATSVRVRAGKRFVTDGPFAETREQLGGYFLIDADDLDAAVAIAAEIPGAARGTVEVRPVVELNGLPRQVDSAVPAGMLLAKTAESVNCKAVRRRKVGRRRSCPPGP